MDEASCRLLVSSPWGHAITASGGIKLAVMLGGADAVS